MGSPMLAGSSLVYSDVQNQDFDQLVRQHATLVKRIAHHMLGRLPDSVQLDDLIQAGMIGLLEASRKYDGGKGASFETYAGIRIRGAMLDEIRRGDWAPRSVHRKSKCQECTNIDEQLQMNHPNRIDPHRTQRKTHKQNNNIKPKKKV